jgi:hypothetical protein
VHALLGCIVANYAKEKADATVRLLVRVGGVLVLLMGM